MNQEAFVYKICRPAEWAALSSAGTWDGAPVDLADGFVHLSTRDQVQGTLDRHFVREGLLFLLAVRLDSLDDGALRWEVSRGGALFPHLYAPLTLSAVATVTPLSPQADGGHAAVFVDDGPSGSAARRASPEP
jgi:uncharacterized protein (DUF952 family)